MLFASATSSGFSIPDCVDGVELRLDLFPAWDLGSVKRWLKESKKPFMLTLRKAAQGGSFSGSEAERERLIEGLLALEPPFFDLEADMAPLFLARVLKQFPKTKFILSHHDFQKTPEDLESIYRQMTLYEAFSYKIAAMAHSTSDALRMLLFARRHAKTSAICMGEKGAFARVLGPIAGNIINYASLDSKSQTAPNQFTAEELDRIYRFNSLSPKTAVYGLIGDPVDKSPGHLHHNRVFREKHLDAVYVKMAVRPEELPDFFPLAKEFGVRGLSVTIPLKEKALPFVEKADASVQQIGAVNTLLFKGGRIWGTNTDGIGALDAIEEKIPVRGKKLVLLGAGGAARAIAFEAKRRGADVVVLNRTLARAKELALHLGCEYGALDGVPADYDILVNASPDPMPIDAEKIKPRKVAMDVIYSPRETRFLKEAARLGCQIVFGEEMFLNQAAAQTQFWIDHGRHLE